MCCFFLITFPRHPLPSDNSCVPLLQLVHHSLTQAPWQVSILKSKLSLLLTHSLWYYYLFVPFTESLIFFSFLLLLHWLDSPSSAGFCSSSSAHINTLGFLPALLLPPEQSRLFITSSQALTYLSLLPRIPNCYLTILRLKMILTCKGSHFLGNCRVRGARVYWVSHETQVKQHFFPDFSAELQGTPKIFPKKRVIKRQKPFCECSLNWYWMQIIFSSFRFGRKYFKELSLIIFFSWT